MDNIIIEGIDSSSGIARFGGKADRYLKTLSLFPGSIPEFAPFSSVLEDPSAARVIAHTLKGTAGNLSVTAVYQAALEFEQTILQGSPDEALYNALIRSCEEAKASLAAFFAGSTAAEKEKGSDEEFMELKNDLIEALNSFEASSCETAINKLKAKTWSTSLDIDALSTLVSNYDYFTALEMLI